MSLPTAASDASPAPSFHAPSDFAKSLLGVGERVAAGRVTVVLNGKGGVGKTMVSVHMAAGLARGVSHPYGATPSIPPQRVLYLELEPLVSGSLWMGAPVKDPDHSVGILLDPVAHDDREAWATLVEAALFRPKHETFLMLPGNEIAIAQAEMGGAGGYMTLADNLAPLRRHFDHIIVDFPSSSWGRVLESVLAAADGVVIPTSPSGMDFVGLRPTVRAIRNAQTNNRALQIDGVILNRVDRRSPREEEQARMILGSAGVTRDLRMYQATIRSLAGIKHLVTKQRTIWSAKPLTVSVKAAQQDVSRFLCEWYHLSVNAGDSLNPAF